MGVVTFIWDAIESLGARYWRWHDRRSFKRHPLAKKLRALDAAEFDSMCETWLQLSAALRELSFTLTVPEAEGLELDMGSMLALAPLRTQVDAVLAARRAHAALVPGESSSSPLGRYVSWAAYYVKADMPDTDFTVLPYVDEIYLPNEASDDSWYRGADLTTAIVFAWLAEAVVDGLRDDFQAGSLAWRLINLWGAAPELTRIRDVLREVAGKA
jgi:hypothetical protein